MNVTYLINSHISYSLPLFKLLERLTVQTRDILVVIAGANVDKKVYVGNTEISFVTHNSFDYTGMIDIVDTPVPTEYVFCLQDTMQIDLDFVDRVEAYANTYDAIAVFGGQCNLALYRTAYLLEQREFIYSMRNCTKKQSIDYEGALWKRANNRGVFPGTMIEDRTNYYPYGPTPRIKEYYTNPGITKWKANYGQTHEGGYYLCP